MSLTDLILGRRLANREDDTRKIGWFEGVPALGLDGLGSSSYGPEAALTVLLPLGAASLAWVGAITASIVGLLAILYLSYRQTIIAYPTNGGAYVVAKGNLGRSATLLAAAALMVDYILNVAVGISAGVGALTSTVPALHPYTLSLCLLVLAIVTFANLRGTSEAGWLFSVPTYVFLASFAAILPVALWQVAASGGHPAAIVPPNPVPPAAEGVGLWILLRAFAAGCTAMTGVEAVSNGVGAFKAPVVPQARWTLTIICASLGLLLAGVALATRAYGIAAMDQTQPGYRSVLAQLVAAVAGQGLVYDVSMTSLLAILCLSANTSFVGFPRLCHVVAADDWLPRPFAVPDRRLVYSVGIGVLAVTAGLLLVAFRGITDRLIPLFAIGAFTTFTLSQAGMVVHWHRSGGNRLRLAINAVGAAVTSAALVVILVAKFAEGAWITVLAIPALVALLYGIHAYYRRLDAALETRGPFVLAETQPPTVLVLVDCRNRMTDRALQFAMTLSPDVVAIHLLDLKGPSSDERRATLKAAWTADVAAPLAASGRSAPRLVVLSAPFRQMHEPLLAFMTKLDADTPGRSVAVLIPELVRTTWWEGLLHTRRGESLRRQLLRHGGPRVNIMTAPWRR